jgi:hypothetical protein
MRLRVCGRDEKSKKGGEGSKKRNFHQTFISYVWGETERVKGRRGARRGISTKFSFLTHPPVPDGLTLQPPSGNKRTIRVPYFDANLCLLTHPLHCEATIVTEVLQKLLELDNKGMSNFGIVNIEDKSIRGGLKKKETTDSLKGGYVALKKNLIFRLRLFFGVFFFHVGEPVI